MKSTLAGLLLCYAGAAFGSTPYKPGEHVEGTIRVWGSAQMAELAERWQKGFARFQPGVKFENHLYGAVSAIAGLYTGVADIAISREIWPVETLAFEQVLGYKPTSFDVATGSFDVPTKSSALHIFVHRDNPLTQLTLAQLANIFGGAHDPPLHPYGYKTDNAGALLFASLVFERNALWNSRYQGFENTPASSGRSELRDREGIRRVDAGQQILDALARDPQGIAIANIHYAGPKVKVLAIARTASSPAVAPSRESTANRTYPLTRQVYIFLNRPPHKPAPAAAEATSREFIRYVLSREGQLDVAAEGAYLPLPDDVATRQLDSVNRQANR
jgi:phosphate transport system substrate-binding protein